MDPGATVRSSWSKINSFLAVVFVASNNFSNYYEFYPANIYVGTNRIRLERDHHPWKQLIPNQPGGCKSESIGWPEESQQHRELSCNVAM